MAKIQSREPSKCMPWDYSNVVNEPRWGVSVVKVFSQEEIIERIKYATHEEPHK